MSHTHTRWGYSFQVAEGGNWTPAEYTSRNLHAVVNIAAEAMESFAKVGVEAAFRLIKVPAEPKFRLKGAKPKLPPSLVATPNIPPAKQTDEELVLERDYWQAKIDGAGSWGGAVGQAGEFRDECINELRRRGWVGSALVGKGNV